jgi:hypothetical protein
MEAALEGNLGTVRDQAGLTRDLALEQVKERAWGKLLSDLEKATSVSQKTFSAEIRENRWTSGHHAVCHFDVSYRPREWRLEFMTAHPLIPFYVEHYDGDEKFEVRKVKVDLTPAEASVLAQGAGKK